MLCILKFILQVEASKSTGAAAADVYKPALWYYDQLMFLIENQEAKRDGVDSNGSFRSENSVSFIAFIAQINPKGQHLPFFLETLQPQLH